MNKQTSSLPWDVVEKHLHKEIQWLSSKIQQAQSPHINEPISCSKCLLRHIAILIVTGDVAVKELKSSTLWEHTGHSVNRKNLTKKHGADWHFDMMNKVVNYFEFEDYTILQEPHTNFGTADLLAEKDNQKIYVEIGTTSLYKLAYNLSSMKDATILYIPNENEVIEFKIYECRQRL